MKRRTFISALIGMAMAPVLCRAKELVAVVAVDPLAGFTLITDPFPLRFKYLEPYGWVQIETFVKVATSAGECFAVNPAWRHAPNEAQVWMDQDSEIKTVMVERTPCPHDLD